MFALRRWQMATTETVKKYLYIEVPMAREDASSVKVLANELNDKLYDAVEQQGGVSGGCFSDHEGGTTGTIYWGEDSVDRHPDPPCPEITEAWLRSVVPSLQKILEGYEGATISLVTATHTAEKLF
jgi:hypothetical protein